MNFGGRPAAARTRNGIDCAPVARYQPKDRFYRLAKEQGRRARSAFKIEELLRRLPLEPLAGAAVLDLGAAPGGWLQVFARLAGPTGRVVGVDLEPIAAVGPNVTTLAGDLRDPAVVEAARALAPRGFALVASDMAPKTTGVHETDCARSLALVAVALSVATRALRPGGALVVKAFMGPDLDPFVARELKPRFQRVQRVRPEATRAGSREIYVGGLGWRGAP